MADAADLTHELVVSDEYHRMQLSVIFKGEYRGRIGQLLLGRLYVPDLSNIGGSQEGD